MSLGALLKAVRETLRVNLELSIPAQCEIMPDGRPTPQLGDYFISVHPALWTKGQDGQRILGEAYGVSCTVTHRISISSPDMLMSSVYLLPEAESHEDVIRRVMIAVHDNWNTIIYANQLITNRSPAQSGKQVEGIITTLKWAYNDPAPILRTGVWVGSDDEQAESVLSAISTEVRFGDAERIQSLTLESFY